MTGDGEFWDRVVTWPGLTEITVVAAGYTTTGVGPRMTLFLDGTPVRTWTLRAGPGRWVRDEYVAQARTAFGRPTLRLQFSDTLDHRAAHQVQHAYVDRIL